MECAQLEIKTDKTRYVIRLGGVWTVATIASVEKRLMKLRTDRDVHVDFSDVVRFDSAAVLLYIRFEERFDKRRITHEGCTPQQRKLYKLMRHHAAHTVPVRARRFLETLGKRTVAVLNDIYAFVGFLGHMTVAWLYLLRHPGEFRYKETIYHIYHSGVTALMIVGMTAFLVGMVIAYQGAVQLARFGADIFIVDTVGISVVRELGPMITAIVIAGRSGSAYTAEIGAMKITEEIAAMRTMGFDPYNFLVLPRVFALLIALPVLVFFADIVGIAGGMVASFMQLHLSFEQFLDRLSEVVDVKHYVLGIVKAPFFAFIIASVGCFRGFQVSDNTESIGLHTTASVVNAIFLVIACDALFSVIYTEFGW